MVIASDSDFRRSRLRAMLGECGIQVAGAVPLDEVTPESDTAGAADFILVDLDEAAGEKLDRLLDVVERLGVPVLFNDGSDPPLPATGTGPELGLRIGLKLTPLLTPVTKPGR